MVFGALGNDLGTGSPAVGGGEPDQLSGVVVSNAVQRAVAPVDYNARATPSGTLSSAAAVGLNTPADATSATAARTIHGCTAFPFSC